MTKGEFKNYVNGMLEKELTGIGDSEHLNEETVDNIEVAFSALLDNARDEEEEEEEEEEDSEEATE